MSEAARPDGAKYVPKKSPVMKMKVISDSVATRVTDKFNAWTEENPTVRVDKTNIHYQSAKWVMFISYYG